MLAEKTGEELGDVLLTDYIVVNIYLTPRRKDNTRLVQIETRLVKDGLFYSGGLMNVGPGRVFDEDISEIDMIKAIITESPDYEEKIDSLLQDIDNHVMVGYNMPLFFELIGMKNQFDGKVLANDYIDIFQMSKRILPQIDNRHSITVGFDFSRSRTNSPISNHVLSCRASLTCGL